MKDEAMPCAVCQRPAPTTLEEAVAAYFDDAHATLWARAFDLTQNRHAAEQFALEFVRDICDRMNP